DQIQAGLQTLREDRDKLLQLREAEMRKNWEFLAARDTEEEMEVDTVMDMDKMMVIDMDDMEEKMEVDIPEYVEEMEVGLPGEDEAMEVNEEDEEEPMIMG
ncbi:hypothetical protein HGM15179_022488, partial [Zosterops borbonicus]